MITLFGLEKHLVLNIGATNLTNTINIININTMDIITCAGPQWGHEKADTKDREATARRMARGDILCFP